MKLICKQCGKEFELSQSEIDFYNSKNLHLPKRCKECRQANKHKKGDKAHNYAGSSTNANTQNKYQMLSNNNSARNSKLIYAILIIAIFFSVSGIILTHIDFIGDHAETSSEIETVSVTPQYKFRTQELLSEHFEKHGIEMGFATKEEYQAAASAVITNENALHKIEAEDGDDVYYLEASNEFVIVSTDGFIRTYFKPNDGIEYYNRQ